MLADRLITEGCDYPLKAAVGKAKHSYSQTLPTYPDAPSTENTFIRVIDE
jgi:hypothetical protein